MTVIRYGPNGGLSLNNSPAVFNAFFADAYVRQYESLLKKIRKIEKRGFDASYLRARLPVAKVRYDKGMQLLARPAVMAIAEELRAKRAEEARGRAGPLREYTRQRSVGQQVVSALIVRQITPERLAAMLPDDRRRLIESIAGSIPKAKGPEEVAAVLEALTEPDE